MKGLFVNKFCKFLKKEKQFLERVFIILGLLFRGYIKILKVVRIIVDLEGSEEIKIDYL